MAQAPENHTHNPPIDLAEFGFRDQPEPGAPAAPEVPFRPLADRVIVKQDPPQDRTRGGLYMPDRNKDWPPFGVVLAIGPGEIDRATGARIPMSVRPGDRVMFARRGSTELEYLRKNDSDRTLLLRDGDIVAIVDPD